MPTFDLSSYDKSAEEQIKGDARMSMFLALRSAFKHRAKTNAVTAKDLAQVLGKHKSQVSRVLNGTNPSFTFETLLVYLEALGFTLTLRPSKVEDFVRSNKDARPFESYKSAVSTPPPAAYFFSGTPTPGAGSVRRASA